MFSAIRKFTLPLSDSPNWKLLCALLVFTICLPAPQIHAQQAVSQTPNLKMNLPPQGFPNWGNLINQNFITLDTTINQLQRSNQGIWSSAKTYALGMLVSFNGITYQSLAANNLNQQPDISPTLWAAIGLTVVPSATVTWPSPCVGVYQPSTNTCVPTGGGGGLNPGAQTQLVMYSAAGTGTQGGPTQITTDAATHSNLNIPGNINPATQLYQNRQDIIDAVADAGAQGAGNSSLCTVVSHSSANCHDDFPVLNALFSATTSSKHKIFLKPTTMILNGCDYYSSQSLTAVPNIDIQGIVDNYFATAVPGGNAVVICFASGQGGIKLGQNSHISGLDLAGGDNWDSTNLATYIVPARYGGTGPNADGLVLAGNNTAENMTIRQFAGDGIRVDSALTGNSDGVTIRQVFVGSNRGSGIVHASSDGQVGTVENAFVRFNQVYNINDYSQYGNSYVGGNTSGGHASGIPVASWTPLNGTFVSDTCDGATCTVTMSASNTMFSQTYINKYDLSANDEIVFQGTADPNLNNVGFWITNSTPTTLTFNCAACVSTASAGGTSVYNPGVRVWSTIGLRGGGWGVGQPNLLMSAGGCASTFIGPYSEGTDHFNDFSAGIACAAVVSQAMGLAPIKSGGAQIKSSNLSVEFPEIMFLHDDQNPQSSFRLGGYNAGFLGPTTITAFNNAPNWGTTNGSTQTFSTEIMGRRSAYGNVSGCWMFGLNNSYSANTLIPASMCLSDNLTVWGRTTLDGTAGQIWMPNGAALGNNRGGGQPDMVLDTCLGTPPATGTWRQGDMCLNVNFNGSGTLYWVDSTTGFSASPTWTPVPFGGNGITALTGDVTATGPGSVAATVAAIQGVAISGTPSAGNVLTASSPTAAAWTAPGAGGTVTTSGTPTIGFIPKFIGSTVLGNSLLDDGITTANTLTYTGTAGITAPFLTATGSQSATNCGLKLGVNVCVFSAGGALNFTVGATNAALALLSAGTRQFSTSYYSWSSSNINATAPDTALFRSQAGEVEVATSATAGSGGGFKAAYFKSGGATFTSNAGCSETTLVGGATAGSFHSGTSGACTLTITMGSAATATNGWACRANDLTTNSNSSTWSQTATSTTAATLSGTTVTGDVVNFSCMAY